MKVFLTGNRGRIGSVVERQLREGGTKWLDLI